MKKKTIILGITGGIAAYKACELVREFVKGGADTHVILTEAARHFVTPLTLQTLSRNPVSYNMFDLSSPEPSHLTISPSRHLANHISLADMADIIIVAPACANTIAKVAHGICDDLLTTTICATKAPVLFAPSMNVNMWENPLTQENVAKLKRLGYHFIAPEKGELACGYKGVGRMADIEKIAKYVGRLLR
jgi:phosphopantothenoylcysteine decarboxylase/phosphopantothenate--cysteine ligase